MIMNRNSHGILLPVVALCLTGLSALNAQSPTAPPAPVPTGDEAPWKLQRLVNVAALGDSLSAMGNMDTLREGSIGFPQKRGRYTRGYLSWVELGLGWNYKSILDYAHGGSSLAQQLEYVSNPKADSVAQPSWGPMNALNPPPDLVFALGGGNGVGLPDAQLEFDKQATIDALKALSSDIRIVSLAIWPLGDKRAKYDSSRKAVNEWMAKTYSSGRVRNVNSDPILGDPANPGILPQLTFDNVHTSALGAKTEADFIVSKLAGFNFLPAPIIYPEALDADDDPTNLLRDFGSDNSQLQKLDGSSPNPENFAVGSFTPAGWRATANPEWQTSSGALPSVLTEADGSNLKKAVFTVPNGASPLTAASAQILFQTSKGLSTGRASTKGFVAGRSYRAGVKIEGINVKNLIYINLLIQYKIDKKKYTVNAGYPYGTAAADVLPSDFSINMLSPEFSLPALDASVQELSGFTVILGFVPGAPAGGTVKISRPYIRQHVFIPSWP